ncbi:MAG TPA: hypothetical protein VHR66_10795 [Gemmataceae bacterium]|jgi:hypothetical protein|nr:hypothetical protein [Gemmataceae bacterium]
MHANNSRPYRSVILLSFGLYLAACVLPAIDWWKTPDSYSTDDPLKGEHYEAAPGWVCLTLGWIFVPEGVEIGSVGYLAWVANPLALVTLALLIFRRPTGAAVIAVVNLLVGALFVIVPPGRPGHPDLPRLGAWLWLGSLLALAIAAFFRRRNVEASR